MTLDREPLRRGYDVDENAIRFSNYFHVLRELVHLSNGWLPLAPEFETKYRLGDHIHDDARALSKVKRRLYELRHPSDYPGAPGRRARARCSTGSPPPGRRASTSRSPTARPSRRCSRRSRSTSERSTRSPTSPRCGC